MTIFARLLLVGLVVLLSALRVGGEKGVFFQAVAHCYVCLLFGYAWGGWSRFPFALALALTAVEAACFVASRCR